MVLYVHYEQRQIVLISLYSSLPYSHTNRAVAGSRRVCGVMYALGVKSVNAKRPVCDDDNIYYGGAGNEVEMLETNLIHQLKISEDNLCDGVWSCGVLF